MKFTCTFSQAIKRALLYGDRVFLVVCNRIWPIWVLVWLAALSSGVALQLGCGAALVHVPPPPVPPSTRTVALTLDPHVAHGTLTTDAGQRFDADSTDGRLVFSIPADATGGADLVLSADGFRTTTLRVVLAAELLEQPAALARAVQRVRVSGRGFVTEDGQPWPWNGVTAFQLVEMVANGREADADAFLAWCAANDVTVARVLTMAWNLFRLSPEEGRAALDRLLTIAEQHGIYVEVVALADTVNYFDESGRRLGVPPSLAIAGIGDRRRVDAVPLRDRAQADAAAESSYFYDVISGQPPGRPLRSIDADSLGYVSPVLASDDRSNGAKPDTVASTDFTQRHRSGHAADFFDLRGGEFLRTSNLAIVQANVNALRVQDRDIVGPVVVANRVQVMHDLADGQGPAEFFLSDQNAPANVSVDVRARVVRPKYQHVAFVPRRSAAPAVSRRSGGLQLGVMTGKEARPASAVSTGNSVSAATATERRTLQFANRTHSDLNQGSLTDIETHISEIGEIVAKHSNVFLEECNEPVHPTQLRLVQDPTYLRHLRALLPSNLLVALGPAGATIAESDTRFLDGSDYMPIHEERQDDGSGVRWVRHLNDLREISEKVGKPVVNDEPQRDDMSRDNHFGAGALTRIFGLGDTFHYKGGLQATMPTGAELDGFNGRRAGWAVIPAAWTGGTYCNVGFAGCPATNADWTTVVKLYATVNDGEGYAVAVGVKGAPGVAWGNGWTPELLRADGRSVIWRVSR
jgi:hypothetical protein